MPAPRLITARLQRAVQPVREVRVSGLLSGYVSPLRRLCPHRRFAPETPHPFHVAAAGGQPAQCRLLCLRNCSRRSEPTSLRKRRSQSWGQGTVCPQVSHRFSTPCSFLLGTTNRKRSAPACCSDYDL